jgi:hypothetical protein
MTCACPRGWCYARPDCRKQAQRTQAAVDQVLAAVAPEPPLVIRLPRGPRADPATGALAAVNRAIDALQHSSGRPALRGLRLVQLYERRAELEAMLNPEQGDQG